MKLGIEPYGNCYLVEMMEPETQTRGGIIIPETARGETTEAVILECGKGETVDGTFLSPDRTLIGRHVLVAKYLGADIRWTDPMGQNRIGKIIKPDQILALVAPSEETESVEIGN